MGRKRSEEDKDDEDDEEDDEDEGFVDFRKRLFVRKFLFQDAWSNGYDDSCKYISLFNPQYPPHTHIIKSQLHRVGSWFNSACVLFFNRHKGSFVGFCFLSFWLV